MLTFDSQQLFTLGEPRTVISHGETAVWTAADISASVFGMKTHKVETCPSCWAEVLFGPQLSDRMTGDQNRFWWICILRVVVYKRHTKMSPSSSLSSIFLYWQVRVLYCIHTTHPGCSDSFKRAPDQNLMGWEESWYKHNSVYSIFQPFPLIPTLVLVDVWLIIALKMI